jgi:uncharacterized Fe-S cluster protein YjdI
MIDTKKYGNEEIDIVWKPSLCIHSKNCWRNLPEVFNPKQKPWINAGTIESKKITDQIDKCPSGALSYSYKTKNNIMDNNQNKIEIASNGPILVHGTIEIKHADGKVETKEKMTALCRCGASANKPFCDGTHRKIEFKG